MNEEELLSKLANERLVFRIPSNECPRLIDSIDIYELVERLKKERCIVTIGDDNELDTNFLLSYSKIFSLSNDECANITVAIQEDFILNTKILNFYSFWDIWFESEEFRQSILNHNDPTYAKWSLIKKFNYKIPTTFIPLYAKEFYNQFDTINIKCLDPCVGWGDRMIGAIVSRNVINYVGFDPNKALRYGYVQLMTYFGIKLIELTDEKLVFSNGFIIYSLPFEIGSKKYLSDETFDLVFTSPPHYDYEVYSLENPVYSNWIEEFYTPLIIESCRCVKKNGLVGLHLSDTSAGSIIPFLNNVSNISTLKISHKIGLLGHYSKKIRPIFVFRRN